MCRRATPPEVAKVTTLLILVLLYLINANKSYFNSIEGGTSIWNRKFEDEFKDNLRHNERGMVSMANGGPNTNASQFFISYAPQPHLDLKYTLFARVIDGFDALDELEKLPVNAKNYRPLVEKRLNSVTVHANPLAI